MGWAVKVIDPASILQDTIVPGSPRTILSDEEASHASGVGSANIFIDGDAPLQGDAAGAEKYGPGSMYARVAFVVDANITSYLMMGSVSPGLFFLFLFHLFIYSLFQMNAKCGIHGHG